LILKVVQLASKDDAKVPGIRAGAEEPLLHLGFVPSLLPPFFGSLVPTRNLAFKAAKENRALGRRVLKFSQIHQTLEFNKRNTFLKY